MPNQKSECLCIDSAINKAARFRPLRATLETKICPESACHSCGLQGVERVRQMGLAAAQIRGSLSLFEDNDVHKRSKVNAHASLS